MKRSAAGSLASSWLPTRYHEEIVFHAGAVASGPANAERNFAGSM